MNDRVAVATHADIVDGVVREAIDAWRRLGLSTREPDVVITLKAAGRKSAVYRLVAAGRSGEDVIAKRCATTTATIEYEVYRSVLPRLAVSQPRCYGMVSAAEERSWLFLEDVGGVPFRAGDEAHRVLAARWMATVHLGTDRAWLSGLPMRGLAYHYALLESAIEALNPALDNPGLSHMEHSTVARALDACATFIARWDDVVALLQGLPETLVHGGFGRKNAHVRPGARRLELLPFDWEAAGCGLPVADLARVDPETYAAELVASRRALTTARVAHVVHLGRAAWCASSIPGEGDTLASPWALRAMPKIEAYANEMEDVLAALGWKRGAL